MKRKKQKTTFLWGILFLGVSLLVLFTYFNEDRTVLPISRVVTENVSPVISFNAEAYTGYWYELGRYPNRFEADCLCATAEYELLNNNELVADHVSVKNTCFKNESISFIEGKAFLTSVPGVLEVQFFPLLKSDYRVLYVDNSYEHAIVSDKKANNLWLLVRNPETNKLDDLLDVVAEKGFDVDKIIFNDMTYCSPEVYS